MRPKELLAIALACAVTAGCGRDVSPVAAATVPANTYFIGPQPGPDRVFYVARNPYERDRSALVDGRKLFNLMNCSGCHGDHGGGGMGPSLRDSLWYYGGDDASIFASIVQGRQHGMPSWGAKLPQDQVWKIVAYIKSMRTPDEPSPPR
jgi:cytochrome c oxidase cbb3-type subunit 3